MRREFYDVVLDERCVYANYVLKQQRLYILTTNRRRVSVGRGGFEFLLKCCVGEKDPVLLLHCSLYFVMVSSPIVGLLCWSLPTFPPFVCPRC
jgi:hypothetical protein